MLAAKTAIQAEISKLRRDEKSYSKFVIDELECALLCIDIMENMYNNLSQFERETSGSFREYLEKWQTKIP